MPIFDQGYQHWQGTLASQLWRWWAITRHSVRMQFKSKWTRFCLVACIGPAFALILTLILWSLLEQGNSWLRPILQLLPPELQRIPQEYRLTIWTFAFHFFFLIQFFFVMVLVLLVGPDLISKDIRFNALPLYLSRPVRRWEYFLGKFGVIAFFTLLVTAAPAVVAWIFGALFSLSLEAIREVLPLLFGSILISLVITVSAGLLMLALSSLSRNSRYVSMMFFAFWLLTNMMSGALYGILRTEDWPMAVSYTRNLQRLEEQLLHTDASWDKLSNIMKLSDLMKRKQEAANSLLPIPGMSNFPQPRGNRPESSFRYGVERSQRNNVVIERSGPFRSLFPWQWSAAILFGLGVLSLCILMFRVKSLDRLR
jgi:ABC-2 type transport system permease protein